MLYMEDDLNLFWKWKMALIFLKMEYDLNLFRK